MPDIFIRTSDFHEIWFRIRDEVSRVFFFAPPAINIKKNSITSTTINRLFATRINDVIGKIWSKSVSRGALIRQYSQCGVLFVLEKI